jgi:serine/threonine protein kinase
MLSLEGRQLGNYTVTRRIRSGGMGAVYEGRQRTAFDRRVAIKVILGTYATDPDMRRRFAREAKTVARLHHPHILPLIEFGDEQGVLYLVMPFIEGGTLTGYLRRHLPDIHEVSTIFLQLLDAVEYAHDEGLIHRDIKSSNVLLESRRNGPPYAYLADFGLVRTIQQAELESSYAGTPIPLDQVPGTPQYMAPEQTLGIVTPSTDIYALGVLLYQMLTGELPFNDPDDIEVIKMQLYAPAPNPSQNDASIPAELGALVTRAMAKHQEERFASVGEFRDAFLAALDRPPEPFEEPPFEEDEETEPLFRDTARPAPPVQELPPLPPRSPRLSQHLRAAPEAIEFGAPAPPRRQRVTGDQPAGSPAQRLPVTEDQEENTPRRPRVPEIAAEAPVAGKRARTTEEPADQADLGRHPRVPEIAAEVPVGGRRPRTSEEPTGQLGVKRPRTTDEQGEAPVPGRRTRQIGEDQEAQRPGGPAPRRPHMATGKFEKAAAPVFVPHRSPQGRSALAPQRPLPGRRSLPGGPASGSRRVSLAIMGGLVIAVFLLVFLLLPRAFGLNLFPSGFPLLGGSSVARISLTVKSANVHDTFLLTASPQTAQADASTRVMPDREVKGDASDRRTVSTSGLHSSGGARATGTLHFDNSSPHQVSISGGFTFIASNNVQVRLTSSVVVPPRFEGQDGVLDASAEAVQPGENGNIQAGALNSPCCGGQVIVSNPDAFSGGSDGGVTHLVAQNDLNGVKNELAPGLRQQAAQKLSAQLQAGEVQAGNPAYNVSTTSDQPVGATATQVTVTVTVTASVLVYNTRTASDLARQLLSNEASHSTELGPGYQLRGALTISTPTIQQQGNNGQLYLSVSASGLWSYAVTSQDEHLWRQNIKGASTTLAQSYLSTQPGITSVHIDLPFGSDHLPTDETQIVFSVN